MVGWRKVYVGITRSGGGPRGTNEMGVGRLSLTTCNGNFSGPGMGNRAGMLLPGLLSSFKFTNDSLLLHTPHRVYPSCLPNFTTFSHFTTNLISDSSSSSIHTSVWNGRPRESSIKESTLSTKLSYLDFPCQTV